MVTRKLLIWISDLSILKDQEELWFKESFSSDSIVPVSLTSKIDAFHLQLLSNNEVQIPETEHDVAQKFIAEIESYSILANNLIVYYLMDWIDVMENSQARWKIAIPYVPLEKYIPARMESELQTIRKNSSIFNRFKNIKAYNSKINQHHKRLLEIWKIIYTNLKKAMENYQEKIQVYFPENMKSVMKLSDSLMAENFIYTPLSYSNEFYQLESKNYRDKELQKLQNYFLPR